MTTTAKVWRGVSAIEARELLGYRHASHDERHPVTRWIEGKLLTESEGRRLDNHLEAACCRLNPLTGALETYLSR